MSKRRELLFLKLRKFSCFLYRFSYCWWINM